MTDRAPFNPPALLDPQGQPARPAQDTHCPRCGASAEKRVASAGFGAPHPVCSVCGHDFVGEKVTDG